MFPPEVVQYQIDKNRELSMQIETIEAAWEIAGARTHLKPPITSNWRLARVAAALGSIAGSLGDEFNSQGDSECEICEGTGMVEKVMFLDEIVDQVRRTCPVDFCRKNCRKVEGEVFRASGDCLCDECDKPYRDHEQCVMGRGHVVQGCDGRLYHL